MMQIQNIDQLDAVFGGAALPMEALATIGNWANFEPAPVFEGGGGY